MLIALLFGKRESVDLVLPDISIETSVDQYLEVQESNVAGVQPCCLLYTSPSPRDVEESRMPSSA